MNCVSSGSYKSLMCSESGHGVLLCGLCVWMQTVWVVATRTSVSLCEHALRLLPAPSRELGAPQRDFPVPLKSSYISAVVLSFTKLHASPTE